MRRLLILSSALAVAFVTLAPAAQAQSRRPGQPDREQERAKAERDKERKLDERGPAPLDMRRADGPCPYVKVLYDAARYVEFEGGREASAAVAYTGEIEGVEAGCEYKSDEPIRVGLKVNFSLGKGPQATASSRSYRYWVAVTERNKTILAKEYFAVPADFSASDRIKTADIVEGIVIPRANTGVSGSNFEILVGFDVTEQQAAFNRAGKRFRVNAGQSAQAGAPDKQ
jgi:hypothetical protein